MRLVELIMVTCCVATIAAGLSQLQKVGDEAEEKIASANEFTLERVEFAEELGFDIDVVNVKDAVEGVDKEKVEDAIEEIEEKLENKEKVGDAIGDVEGAGIEDIKELDKDQAKEILQLALEKKS